MKAKDWRPTSFVETAPGGMTDEEADASRLEQRRALHDFLRHLMTLDAGALVLVATLIEKVFAQPLQRNLVGVSIAAFFVSLLCGGVACLVLLAHAPRVGALRMPSSDRRTAVVTAVSTWLGFLVGVAALGWFFLVNWFR
jgi:hypothetical protein